jgi:sulfhydrogenase subunit gamma (sulfur reductase)
MKNEYVPYPATIERIRQETPDAKTFSVRFINSSLNESFRYRPGQFMEISILGLGEAPISIASSPSRHGCLEFTIRAVGSVTKAINKLSPGDIIYLRGPYGNSFPFEEWSGKNIYFIAGGIGFAPLRSLIRLVMDCRNDFLRIKILYGVKTPDDICFKEELNEWEREINTEILLAVDRSAEGWEHTIGIVTELWKKTSIHPDNSVSIVCGPPVMMSSVASRLLKSGFSENDIFMTLERYMKCGIGMCGHCNIGNKFVCTNGPVFTLGQVKLLPNRENVLDLRV